MARNHYIVFVFSQKAAQVKKLILSPLILKASAALLAIFLVGASFFVYDYVRNIKKMAELQHLSRETQSRQAELHSFVEKITFLEEQVSRLKDIEREIKSDFQEVKELKRIRKIVPPAKKKFSAARENAPADTVRVPRREFSVLEEERPRLLGRLQRDLMDLQEKVFQREQMLADIREFLDTQKAILLALPSLWPVSGPITSEFGNARASASFNGMRPHAGVDIWAPSGTQVVAAADGVVLLSGRESEYGLLIALDHGYGYTTRYGHLKGSRVQPGDRVRKGQVLGTVGVSGNSTGPHLHYEVRFYGEAVDPARYLNQNS